MFSNKEEIEAVLKAGKEILSNRPSLESMKVCDVIEELDDGTSELIHNRWGAAAWIVVNSISSFETESLVEQLSKVDSGLLTYKYAGYLLLTNYGVNLEDLLLQAEKHGQFDRIVLFAVENLVYEETVYEQNILPLLQVMEAHLEHQSYHRFLWSYAKHIEKMGAQNLVANQIGSLVTQSQYDLMNKLCAGWYSSNEKEASEALGKLLAREGIWNKKAAIKFLRVSVYHNKSVFQKYYAQIEAMALKDDQLWLMIIPLYIEYICTKNIHTQDNTDYIQERVFGHLREIPSGSLNARYTFLETVQYIEDVPENLNSIVVDILTQSFDKEQRFVKILDHLLYVQIQKGDSFKALKLMQDSFVANQYSGDYENFFRSMVLVRGEISTYSKEVTQQAIAYMLFGDISQLFFGLGLLTSWGDIKKLYEDDSFISSNLPCTLNTFQIIQLEKAILYFTFDTKRICHIAFQLLKLVSEENEQYIAFCLEEVFESYPTTMYRIAKEYEKSTLQSQAELSQRVIEAYDQQIEDKKKCYEILDLRPSRDHTYVYHKALVEHKSQICKRANEESFLGQIFKTRKLKYGVRNGHVMIGRKGEKTFQANPYARIQHEIELNALYIRDPVGFELRKRVYLMEVKSNAANHTGLFASIEREG